MKKLIIYLCVLCMAVSVCVPCVSAKETDNTFASDLAYQLSFYQKQNSSAELTRAEFAKILCVLTDAGTGVFTAPELADMDAGHELYPYVAKAISLGYFSAPESGIFNPDDGVYAYQAVSTFIDILGYRPLVQSEDYMADWAYASKLGLFFGLELSPVEYLTQEQMSVMCVNVLDVDVMEAVGFGDTVSYKSRDGRNLIAKYYDAEYVEGVVKANSQTSLMSPTNLGEGEVTVGDITLKTGTSNAENLLGYAVECWYRDDTVIYIAKSGDNNVITLPYANIDSADKTQIISVEDKKDKKYKLDPEADLIYNNSAVYNFDEKLLSPATGYVNLIDNNGDGKYDVVMVYEYVNYFIVNFNPQDMHITDGIRNITVDIDADDKTSVSILNYNSSLKSLYPSNANSLYRKNIVSAQISLDGENITLVRCDSSLSGTVRGIYGEGKDMEITIDSHTYKLSGDYAELMEKGMTEKIQTGMTGTFYFDYTGSIAYADFANGGYEYGFMSKAKSGKGLDACLNIRIFTGEGKWVTYQIDDKIKIDGQKTEPEIAENLLCTPQVIRYKENSEGKIYDIDLFEDKTSQAGYIGYTENEFTYDFYGKSQKFKSKDKSFSKKYGFELTTTDMFCIPQSAYMQDGSIDEDAVFLADSTYFLNDKNYDIKVFDSDEFFIPEVIIVEKASEEAYQSRMLLVNKVSETLDENGDEVCFISGYLNGAECRYMYDNEAVSQHLRPGDIVRVALSGVGEIRILDPLVSLDYENMSPLTDYSINAPGMYGYNTSAGVYIGTAYNVDYKRNTVICANAEKDTFYKFVGSGNVFWIFDTEEKEFVPADISVIEGEVNSSDPSIICVIDRYLETKDIVVVK